MTSLNDKLIVCKYRINKFVFDKLTKRYVEILSKHEPEIVKLLIEKISAYEQTKF